jgi:hypothetical protein
MNQDFQAFKRYIAEHARFIKKKPDAAFVDWFSIMRKQNRASRVHQFIGGDGGIDSVIIQDTSVVLSQLKYTKAKKGHIREFETTIRSWSDKQSFEKWVTEDVSNSHAKKIFRQTYDEIKRRGLFVEWEFVSLDVGGDNWLKLLSGCVPLGRASVRVITVHDLLYYFALEQTGAGYTDAIELSVPPGNMDARHPNGFRTLVSCVRIDELVSSVKSHGKLDTLLARNVRLEIPRSPVNVSIRETLNKHPDQFFFGNNGIHIITTLAINSGGKLKLEQPAIINGGQTIKQLVAANPRHNRGEVLIRITEIPKAFQSSRDGRRFVNDIIFMSNNNNKMEPWNLRSNDPDQVTIAKRFHMNDIFYQRKDFEWRESKDRDENNNIVAVIESTELATAFCCADSSIGPAKVKEMGLAPLFNGSSVYYKRIFDSLTRRPEEALSLARVYLIVQQWAKHAKGIPKDFSSFGRTSANYVFSLIWRALGECGQLRKPYGLIPGKIYRNSCPHLGEQTQKIVKDLFAIYKQRMTAHGVQQNDLFRGEEYWDEARRKILTKMRKKLIQKSALKDLE